MYGFAHVEIPTTDLKRATVFFGALFLWQFKAFYGDDYLLILDPAGHEIGGLTRVDKMLSSPEYVVYVEVGDIEKVLQTAQELGGTVVRPRTELPGDHGAYGVVQSPDGYYFGVWTKAS
jgi:uncharacterized protein